MEAAFAGATSLNAKYDIDQAHLLGRGKLSVVHRTRRCVRGHRRKRTISSARYRRRALPPVAGERTGSWWCSRRFKSSRWGRPSVPTA